MDSVVNFVHGIRAVRLVGTRDERATQHGRMVVALKPEERARLAIYPLAKKNQHLISRAAKKARGIGPILSKFYDAFVLERFLNLPREYRNRLKPFAKAAKINERILWQALFQPDLLMVLAATANEKTRAPFLSAIPGCTSGTFINDDSFLFLRNLDYPAASHWEKFPTAFYHEPTEIGALKYVSMSSLGIHTPGLTGFNEAGIAFSLHAQFSKKTSIKGVPIFFLGEDILEEARTLEEAIHFCKKFKPIGNWSINLASFKEKKAVSVELSEGKIFVRTLESGPHGELIAQANGFQCPVFQQNELHLSGAFFEDAQSRKMALEKSNPQTVIEAFNALSSHVDPITNETRIFGNTVSLSATIQSIVIDVSQSCFYFSNRSESPTGHGPYVKLPFRYGELHHGFQSEVLTPSVKQTSEFMKALHSYHEAYISWQVLNLPKANEIALAHLIEACEQLPHDPHLSMQRGYFELMNHEPKNALVCFEHALTESLSPHLKSVALYFNGVCFDLLHQRANAVKHYKLALDTPVLDQKLREKAQIRLEKPFLRAYCQKIEPDLQFVEPLQYN